MPRLYLFPGFAGSELYYTPDLAPNQLFWVSYTQLFAGNLHFAALSPDGVTPLDPCGIQLYPGPPLAAYYGPAAAVLMAQLAPHGYTFHPQPYDWRLDFLSQETPAVADILANCTPADPCTLVGHSFGGLIARLVWSRVVAAGGANLIRRVVTLGTPHWGSYQALRVFSNDENTIDQLFLITYSACVNNASKENPNECMLCTPAKIINLFATFPSVYDSLPNPNAPDAADDILRRDLYSAANYQGVLVEENWLTESLNVNGPFLLSPTSIPPCEVLTCICGTGTATANRLIGGSPVNVPSAYTVAGDGDGVVTTPSAEGPGMWIYHVHALHADLPLATAASGLLAQAILEAHPDCPPSPVIVAVPGPMQPILGPIPFPPIGWPTQGLMTPGHGC